MRFVVQGESDTGNEKERREDENGNEGGIEKISARAWPNFEKARQKTCIDTLRLRHFVLGGNGFSTTRHVSRPQCTRCFTTSGGKLEPWREIEVQDNHLIFQRSGLAYWLPLARLRAGARSRGTWLSIQPEARYRPRRKIAGDLGTVNPIPRHSWTE